MTQWHKDIPLTDEILVAWLDNQLNAQQHHQVEKMLNDDPELAERLAELDRASVDFPAAFAPLLDEAPTGRLHKNLTALLVPTVSETPRGFSRRALIAATISALAVGVIGGMKGKELFEQEDDWRDSVAQYMALYTHETFEGVTPSASAMQQQLSRVSTHLGLSLPVSALTLKGSEFKSARMLNYDDQDIAQIVWDEGQSGPLALCITAAVGQTGRGLSAEKRRGMNVIYWQKQQHQFMLIGHMNTQQLLALAKALSVSV